MFKIRYPGYLYPDPHQNLFWVETQHISKFCRNTLRSFCVILVTNQHKRNRFGGGEKNQVAD